MATPSLFSNSCLAIWCFIYTLQIFYSPHNNLTAVDDNRIVDISWRLLVLDKGESMPVNGNLRDKQSFVNYFYLVKMSSRHSSEAKFHPLSCLKKNFYSTRSFLKWRISITSGSDWLQFSFLFRLKMGEVDEVDGPPCLTLHSKLVMMGGSVESG